MTAAGPLEKCPDCPTANHDELHEVGHSGEHCAGCSPNNDSYAAMRAGESQFSDMSLAEQDAALARAQAQVAALRAALTAYGMEYPGGWHEDGCVAVAVTHCSPRCAASRDALRTTEGVTP